MSDTSVSESLRGLEFFDGIDDSHLDKLAAIARPLEFPAHREIFQEHDLAKDVYVIISGQVSLAICQPKVGCRQLMDVGPGELIGWSPLVGRHRLTDTARTMVPTVALAINGEQLLELCKQDTGFGFQFMHRAAQVLAQRLGATRMRLLDMGGQGLPDVRLESD